MSKPLIIIPIGDPAGIGPEIVAKALAEPRVTEAAGCIAVGDKKIMEQAIRITGADLRIKTVKGPEEGNFEKGILNLIDLDNVDMDQLHSERSAECAAGQPMNTLRKASGWQTKEGRMRWQPLPSTRSLKGGRHSIYRSYGDIQRPDGDGRSAYHV